MSESEGKAKKVPITECEIRTYAPMKDGHGYIAIISGFWGWAFHGATPMAAHKAADDWRKLEHLRLTDPKAYRAASKAYRAASKAAKKPANAGS